MPIDMWSLGCILAELLTGYALFPGEDENDQLACIIELLGMPPQKLLDQSKRSKNFISAKGYPRYCLAETLEDGRIILGSGSSRQGKERGPPGSKNLKKALKGCDDPLFMNFLCGCLEWDPEVRMTPAAALKHSWFRRRLPRPPQHLQPNTVPAIGGSSSNSNMSPATKESTPSDNASNTVNANTLQTNPTGSNGSDATNELAISSNVIDKRLQHSCTIINNPSLSSLNQKTPRTNSHITNTLNSNLANANVSAMQTIPDGTGNVYNPTNKNDNGSNSGGTSGAVTITPVKTINNGSSASITNKLRVLLSANELNNSTINNHRSTTANLSPISSITSSTKNVLGSMQQPLSPPITSSVTNHITSTQ